VMVIGSGEEGTEELYGEESVEEERWRGIEVGRDENKRRIRKSTQLEKTLGILKQPTWTQQTHQRNSLIARRCNNGPRLGADGDSNVPSGIFSQFPVKREMISKKKRNNNIQTTYVGTCSVTTIPWSNAG